VAEEDEVGCGEVLKDKEDVARSLFSRPIIAGESEIAKVWAIKTVLEMHIGSGWNVKTPLVIEFSSGVVLEVVE
ncbi:hypothetical protein Gotur_023087, partial [Gossypium turneri]